MATHAWLEPSEALHARVRQLIDGATAGGPLRAGPAREPRHGATAAGSPDGERAAEVDALALAIARYQATHVPAVAQLYAARGIEPAALASASQIPAMPAELFRLRRMAAHDQAEDERCFRTSGTSQGAAARGEHPMRTTRTYAGAALAWGARLLWPDRPKLRLLSLVAPEKRATDSSLSFMVARFGERLDPAATSFFDGQTLDVDGFARACRDAQAHGQATLVCATAFALVELCDRLGAERLVLPAGSRVMQTGGFKRRSRELEPGELRRLVAARFALPEAYVVGEYGMTELSSQLYEGTLCRALGRGFASAAPGRYFAPPWVRVTAVDPIELVPLPLGEVGLCQLLDLANVDSALVVLTADVCRQHADGSIELTGRAPGAEPRGCSLAAEEALDPALRSGTT